MFKKEDYNPEQITILVKGTINNITAINIDNIGAFERIIIDRDENLWKITNETEEYSEFCNELYNTLCKEHAITNIVIRYSDKCFSNIVLYVAPSIMSSSYSKWRNEENKNNQKEKEMNLSREQLIGTYFENSKESIEICRNAGIKISTELTALTCKYIGIDKKGDAHFGSEYSLKKLGIYNYKDSRVNSCMDNDEDYIPIGFAKIPGESSSVYIKLDTIVRFGPTTENDRSYFLIVLNDNSSVEIDPDEYESFEQMCNLVNKAIMDAFKRVEE